jgi:hypothetical protein
VFIRELFKDDVRHEIRAAHIRFVAAAVGPAVRLLERGADALNSPALDADLLVSDEALDALARLMKDKQGSVFEPPEPDQPDESLELAL